MKKFCKRCGEVINEKNGRYTHLEDWSCQEMEGDSWWHLECFKKAVNRDLTVLEQQAASMLSQAGTIMQNLPPLLKQERYEIDGR